MSLFLFQLKEAKTELKIQLIDLRQQNLNLQMQIQHLNGKLQETLMLPKYENTNTHCSTDLDPIDEILKILENRTATQLSDDGVSSNSYNFLF